MDAEKCPWFWCHELFDFLYGNILSGGGGVVPSTCRKKGGESKVIFSKPILPAQKPAWALVAQRLRETCTQVHHPFEGFCFDCRRPLELLAKSPARNPAVDAPSWFVSAARSPFSTLRHLVVVYCARPSRDADDAIEIFAGISRVLVESSLRKRRGVGVKKVKRIPPYRSISHLMNSNGRFVSSKTILEERRH